MATREEWDREIDRLSREIMSVCHRMYARRLIVASDGNVSVRIAEDELLITRSGICKGEMDLGDVIRIDFDGKVVGGDGRPSSEAFMHIACYQERPDISSIVHAHPPTAVAFTLAGQSLAQCIIPEVVLTLGSVPTLPYTTPTTTDVPDAIRRVIKHADALMLERHGAVCVGTSPKDAYFKLEKLEHAAEVTWMARQLGRVKTLPPDEVRRILSLRSKFTLDGKNPLCNDCVLACYDGIEGA
ncbi:MAG: class II aldolase/adducin family protein [Salinibacterium sp.]|nr:class II aldolase/adducin family protein [Salinibacterium sp.]